ncbi:MAG TPA: HEAT repeat domain-containing protein [Pirellulaceae bacterium]|nr:HEAT repeat domain-containing protein [Pirellulaceae bacterium]
MMRYRKTRWDLLPLAGVLGLLLGCAAWTVADEPAKVTELKAAVDEVPAAEKKPVAPVVEQPLSYERHLLDARIEPTSDGLKAYLISLHPGPDTKQTLSKLVQQLGAEAYLQREDAMTQLRQRSAIAMETLKDAASSTDPEIRWRSKKLLENAVGEADATFFAIFKTIEARQFKGLAAPIMMTLSLCGKDHVRFAARRALAATATPNDTPLLKQELKNADPQARMAVLGALAALSEKDAVEDALSLVDDKDDRVRMAAGKLLAQQGRSESLPLLVALLDANAVEIRGEASRTLKVVAGQDFGFIAYDKDEDRAAARTKWQVWLKTSGQTAKLLPLTRDTPFEYGRLLVCSYAQSKVFEFDADAKDVTKPRWEVQMGQQPWAVQGLADGRRLVAYYGGRKVVEFGPENDAKKPIWESEALPGGPMGVQRLDNGNTLVACTDAEIVAELDAQGKIVKKWTVTGRPVDVQRLESGNTLVTLQNGQKVVEIDSEGKEKWSTKLPLLNPFAAQRLDNGNTLVTVLSGGKVVEVNPEGDKEVWSLSGLVNPYHARRLLNGNTLVVDQNGVYEYETAQKKVLWKLQIPHISRASRF